ncbi:hypothetical protein ASE12_05445 [Aeromicrobium sp. Root236]|uniref:GDSL-type esterase/lipase family protein n=1 Tax=Aeromicrobium sp. Root236 TaxID=1736498 RepID=UPI0006F3317E|nr:GDSL-type esterase/lipase family protein [Aeromicrobium sp. Root236]KRC64258.1 hypothetical protein ASE12_05445 [Aeromicrobium sp. Root236]
MAVVLAGTVAPSSARPVAAVSSSTPPSITGTPQAGLTLTVRPGVWSPTDATLTYRWLSGTTSKSLVATGGTTTTYVVRAADVGKRLVVEVTGSKSGYTSLVRSSSMTATVVAAATITPGQVSIEGSPVVDSTLTAASGTWAPAGLTFGYQWLTDSVAVSGATATTYTPGAGDLGKRVSVRVTGSKTGYPSVSATSAPSAVVVPGTLTATPTPSVSGTPQVDATLTAEPGTWAPAGVQLSYQWLAGTTAQDSVAVSGATSSTYTPGTDDTGRRLSVQVMGSKPGYASVTTTSALSEAVTPAPIITPATPTITGTAEVGRTLTADSGTWSPDGVQLAFQWLRDGVAAQDATGTAYDLTAADRGSAISVRVTGTKAGFPTTARTSTETQAVAEGTQVSTPTPTVTGTTAIGDVLTAVPGDWDNGVTVAYQWLRDGTALTGETSVQHTVVAADVGSLMCLTVTGARAGYASQSRTSAQLAVTGAQSASKVTRALETFRAAFADVDRQPVDVFVGPSDSLADGARATSIQKRWISVLRDDLRGVHQPVGVKGGFGYLDPLNWGKFPDNPISYVSGVGAFEQGLGRQTLALFNSTQTITVKAELTDLDIVYAGLTGTAGTFTYSVDGGPEVRVYTGAKPTSRGGYVEKVSGLAPGVHQVVMRGTGGGSPAIVEGVMLYNGDRSSGVRVWEGGASGLAAANYVAPGDRWAESLKEVHPDLVVLPIGSNDFALGTPAKDTEVKIREIIATIRARVDTDPSIVLMPYYERPTSGTGTWAAYEEMYARIASTDPKIAVFDLAPLFGAYGSAQRAGLMSSDMLHPSDTGYALIADRLAAFLTPSPQG